MLVPRWLLQSGGFLQTCLWVCPIPVQAGNISGSLAQQQSEVPPCNHHWAHSRALAFLTQPCLPPLVPKSGHETCACEGCVALPCRRALDLKPSSPSYALNLMHGLELEQDYSQALHLALHFCTTTEYALNAPITAAWTLILLHVLKVLLMVIIAWKNKVYHILNTLHTK